MEGITTPNFPSGDHIKPVTKESKLRFLDVLKRAIRHFSVFERAVFIGLFVIMTLTSLTLLSRVNNLFTSLVPVEGGELNEGVVGSARFINPVIAISDSDRDLTTLVYSGLMRIASDGTLIPDMAESYEITDEGKTYIFKLREDITFHDGEPLTTDDVEFTIQKVLDGAIKSPKRPNWVGVTIEKINTREIKFHLKQPYAPFINNTTIGILPKHLWKDLTAEEFPLSLFNFEPVGSGPFEVESITRTPAGIPNKYTLKPNRDFPIQSPHLKKLTISFFPNEQAIFDAYTSGVIESIHSVNPENLPKITNDESQVVTATLPRIFGVFFNQNQAPIFLDGAVRKALETSIDRVAIIENVLGGYGTPVSGPLPPEFSSESYQSKPEEVRMEEATRLLDQAGWKYNEEEHVREKTTKKGKTTERQVLAFSISTANAPELKKTANLLKETWEKLGVRVDIKVFEIGDLNQNVIRARKYDALLFGQIVGRDLDLYAFWHSSQRNDPGLNVSMYANSKADTILEEARIITDNNERIEKYKEFAEEISKDTPAVFLYSPQFIYVMPKKIKNATLTHITTPSERLSDAFEWYIDTERVWKIFTKN